MAASTKQRHPAALAYASAMLQVGSALGEASAFGEQLTVVAHAISDDPQMRVFIESPKISRENKKAVLSSALTGKVAEQVLNLLKLLIDRGRQFLVQDIADTYTELEDVAAGRVKATITSAVEMPAEFLNPDRTQDTPLQQVLQRLARDLGQHESILLSRLVPVLVLRPGWKERWQRIHQGVLIAPAFGITVVRTADAIDARRHRGQMPQCDGRIMLSKFRIVVLWQRVERALTVVDEQPMCRAGEGLRHRPHALPPIGFETAPDFSPVANENQPLDPVVRYVVFEPGDSLLELRRIDTLRFRRGLLPTLPRKDHVFRSSPAADGKREQRGKTKKRTL